jgi:transforming growth factor-beta-induced protein
MSKRFLAPVGALSVLLLAACSDSPSAPVDAVTAEAPPSFAAAARPSTASIVDLAVATDALSTLVFAIGYSDENCGTGFGALLSGAGQYTAFAPTNDAFDTLIGALGAELVLSCDVLPTVLAFHVAPGRLNSQAVLNRKSIRMLSGESAAVSGTTIAGAPLNLDLVNISASNGIVHVVDAVLIPGSILAALN